MASYQTMHLMWLVWVGLLGWFLFFIFCFRLFRFWWKLNAELGFFFLLLSGLTLYVHVIIFSIFMWMICLQQDTHLYGVYHYTWGGRYNVLNYLYRKDILIMLWISRWWRLAWFELREFSRFLSPWLCNLRIAHGHKLMLGDEALLMPVCLNGFHRTLESKSRYKW